MTLHDSPQACSRLGLSRCANVANFNRISCLPHAGWRHSVITNLLVCLAETHALDRGLSRAGLRVCFVMRIQCSSASRKPQGFKSHPSCPILLQAVSAATPIFAVHPGGGFHTFHPFGAAANESQQFPVIAAHSCDSETRSLTQHGCNRRASDGISDACDCCRSLQTQEAAGEATSRGARHVVHLS